MSEESIVAIVVAIISSGILSTAITAIINAITNRKKKLLEESAAITLRLEALESANRVILEDRIDFVGRSYVERGYIYVEEKERIKRMWDEYHNTLHGNGYLDEIILLVNQLEVRVRMPSVVGKQPTESR